MIDRGAKVWAMSVAVGLVFSALVEARESAEGAGARFDRDSVPAAGRTVTNLSISEFGRYAVAAESASGTALRVVDRMAGAGELAGEAGKRDGRIDLFLDRGDVRVETVGARLATGVARLSARRFVDRSAAPPELFVEGRLVAGELADLEERSWWLEIDKPRRITIEAAGRALSDLRLWQNGVWLVDAVPESSEIEPESGRPLRLLRSSVEVGTGLYRLTAYGGLPLAWSRESSSNPLFLRGGLTRDAVALAERRVVSPFGFDRVLVGGAADHYRLELFEPGEASMSVVDFDPAEPFTDDGADVALDREAMPPVATLEPPALDGDRIVTVRAPAGTPYILQHFPRGREHRIARPARYWISTIASGAPGDILDGTMLVVDRGDGRKRAPSVVASDLPRLGPGSGWAGRFNLFERSTLHFELTATTELELRSSGSPLQARIEPFFLSPPQDYAKPPSRPAPAVWTLDPGYYVLELMPVERGIAEVELVPKGAPKLAPTPRGPARVGELELSPDREWIVLLNERPGVAAGLIVRELPLDLVAALPISLRPGEEIAVPFRAPASSRLAARATDGAALEIAVDGGGFAESAAVDKGAHIARVRSPGGVRADASLALTLAERDVTTSLPPVSSVALASQPLFETLAAGAPRHLDLARDASATFRVLADEPALYRIETRGLLATEAALRTRTLPKLVEDGENGTGRNVRLAAYLRAGEYQLTVRPRGESAGHLGVALERSPVDDGGRIPVADPELDGRSDAMQARATLAPGRAVAYRFAIAEPAIYRVSSRGLARDFRLRLEDDAGWPVAEPAAEGEQLAALLPGEYRLIVLPQPVEARATVAVERFRGVPQPPATDGAKEGALFVVLDRAHDRIWHEGGAEGRTDDRFRFEMPARTVVSLSLTPEMEGELFAAGGAGSSLGKLRPGRGLRLDLERGTYELRVRAVRRDEGRRYSFSIRPEALVNGVRRAIVPPVDLVIAVGETADVELTSSGGTDLKARLYEMGGRELAAGDDRPGDWNFRISRRLEPGNYRLRVETAGVGSTGASGGRDRQGQLSEVGMRIPRERQEAPLAAPGATELELDDRAALIELSIPPAAEIVAAGARADENVALVLEERQGESWNAVASSQGRASSVALPLPRERGALRLRVSALDRRPVPVRISVHAGPLSHKSEADLMRGFALTPLPGVDPPIAAAVVDLASPGCFRRTDEAPLQQSLAMGAPFAPAAPTLAAVGLAIPLAQPLATGEAPRVRASRARVGEGGPLALFLPAGVPILCDVADGGAAMVEVVATGGEPVVGFVAESGGWGASTALGDAGGSRSAAAAPAGSGRTVELWNAARDPVEARLDGWLATARRADASALGAALTSWTVPAGSAIEVPLPAGEKRLRLAVASGGAALLVAGDEPRAFVRATGESRVESLMSDADRVLLFADRKEGAAGALVGVAVDPGAASATSASLEAGGRFERRFPAAGRLRLTLPRSDTPTRITIDGADEVLLLAADANVRRAARGESIEAPAGGGELRLSHPPGFVAIHRARPSDPPTAMAAGARLQALALPAVIALSGAELAFETRLAAPALLSLRSTSALAASISAGERIVASESFAAGARLDVIVAAGTARIGVRGLAGEPLSGELVLFTSSIGSLAEGLGEARLVAAGESRAFGFRMPAAGVVGVGVRADLPGVEARLVDVTGRELGRGVAIWPRLEAGDYRLIVDVPAGAAAATIRPALVGTTPPGDGPPPEQVERFLRLAGEAPQPAARATAGAVDRPVGSPAPEESEEDEPEGDEMEEEDEDLESPRRIAAAEDGR